MFRFLYLFLIFSAALYSQTDCRQTIVIVNAFDARGIPIDNLVANDFKATYLGRPATIFSSTHREDSAGRTVILLDTSGSMTGSNDSNKWKLANTTALEFVSSAHPESLLSLKTFATKIEQQFEERKSMLEWLRNVASGGPSTVRGKTALYDGIVQSLRGLEPGDSIFVITDGGDNSSPEATSRVERSLQNKGVRLFAFLLFEPSHSEELGRAGSDLLELTRRSGGFLVSISPRSVGSRSGRYEYNDDMVKAIRSWTRMMQAKMAGYYVLTLGARAVPAKSADLKLEIVDAEGHKSKDVTLAYPRRLADCTPQTVPD